MKGVGTWHVAGYEESQDGGSDKCLYEQLFDIVLRCTLECDEV